MQGCHKCEKCGKAIHAGVISGLAHIVCKNCDTKYQLDERSMKKYIFLPLITVGISVASSIYFLKDASIDIKTIFIIGLSFMMAYIVGRILIRLRIFKYEKHQQ